MSIHDCLWKVLANYISQLLSFNLHTVIMLTTAETEKMEETEGSRIADIGSFTF